MGAYNSLWTCITGALQSVVQLVEADWRLNSEIARASAETDLRMAWRVQVYPSTCGCRPMNRYSICHPPSAQHQEAEESPARARARHVALVVCHLVCMAVCAHAPSTSARASPSPASYHTDTDANTDTDMSHLLRRSSFLPHFAASRYGPASAPQSP